MDYIIHLVFRRARFPIAILPAAPVAVAAAAAAVAAFFLSAVEPARAGTAGPPAATSASALNVTTAGDDTYEFTVTYADDGAIQIATLDAGDVAITGPGTIGALAITFVEVDEPSDGSPRTATYNATPPGGTWDATDNGAYTLDIVAGQVSDIDSGANTGQPAFASFTVNVDTFIVTTDVDEDNGAPAPNLGTGTSLREAIAAASSGNTIRFAASLDGDTITIDALSLGQLVIDKSLTVDASDLEDQITIDGTNDVRIIEIAPGSHDVTLHSLHIIRGEADLENGGAIRNQSSGQVDLVNCTITESNATAGGGIRHSGGTLSLTDCLLSSNSGLSGAALSVSGGTSILTRCTISENHALEDGGGIETSLNAHVTLADCGLSDNLADSDGGSIYAMESHLSLSRSSLSRNRAVACGGALYLSDTAFDAIESLFRDNDATADGGAISCNGSSTATLNSSTLAENSAMRGGGIFQSEFSSPLILTNCTLTRNRALGAGSSSGGAIHGARGSASIQLTNCTVALNSSEFEGGGIDLAGGGLHLVNSIIAGNHATVANPDIGDPAGSTITTRAGANLIGNHESVEAAFPAGNPNANGDRAGTPGAPIDPRLAPLGSYGGPTPTIPPLAGSPAIDNGIDLGLLVDQRGFPRPRDGDGDTVAATDIGAVENATTFIVDTAADENNGTGDTSLREAIAAAKSDPEANRIVFDPSTFPGAGTLTLDSRLRISAQNLAIDASGIPGGVTVSGDTDRSGTPTPGDVRVFRIDSFGNVAMHHLTITGGNTAGSSGSNGGGIYVIGGTLTLTSATISGNTAASLGGGIYNAGANLALVASTLSGNTAIGAGGLYSNTDLVGTATTLLNTTVTGNTATGAPGGGIYNVCGWTGITHSTITGNTAPADQGGGVASWGDDQTITSAANSIIAGNADDDVEYVNDNANTFMSLGYNLVGSGNGASAFGQPGDTNGAGDPLLAPLANYGGPTDTMPPLAGSGAIDAADPGTANAVVTGQRGLPRPQGPAPDTGAVEVVDPLIFPDTDDDLIDDRLEPLFGFVVGVADGHLDADTDNSTNAEELANKTDPRNGADFLQILDYVYGAGYDSQTNRVFDITWKTFPGLSYTLECDDDLTFPAPLTLGPFDATGFTETRSVIFAPPFSSRNFIRVLRN